MRLLEFQSDGEFSLTGDLIDNIPSYAILSHTWGADIEEVNFRDLTDRTGKNKAGYNKIRFCGEQARRDGLKYFWVDTCCIDKSNNAELAEAINSMFRWYQNAAKCYVYLSDVSTNDHDYVDPSLQLWQSDFRKSRWFTRGWTLQELIAPLSVEFFGSDGKRLGDKKSLERQLHEITGIAVLALQGTAITSFSIKERMSWAKSRETKRAEDKAYSLLGIFGIQMTLIYSEGAENAFRRLREELYKREKKHHLDELSTVSESTFSSHKRLKTLHSQSSSTSLYRDPRVPDHDLHSYSDYNANGINGTTKQSLIDQLYFSKIDERLTSLTAAQGTTCRWFFTKPEYTSWHDVAKQEVHSGFLWIKGNPGTGKSTLMKLLFEEAKRNAQGDSSKITLSFFFLARGTVEEKSTTGLYRSLLHQLFEKVVESRDSLEWMTVDGARTIQRNGWHEEALKQTLTHAIRKLKGRSLTIFVDALDECDKKQVMSMVCFFEELCDHAREAKVWLQICLSSRHYPTIFIQKGIEVILEREIGHTEDIEQYIKSKLKLGKSKQAESLRSEILEKSSNIFLWVVLVLDILNSEYSDGSISLKRIRERLKAIPPKLTDLFEMILMRDGENLEQLQLCLKWILFATRPLKPQELYFAIQIGLDKKYTTCWDQEDIELDQIKTFVRSSSKGLAEVTRNRASEVQFIHESVRDFLLGKYEDQWSGVSGNFVGHSHEILRDCCLAQLNASINNELSIPDPLPQASKAAQLRETVSLKFPFLEYAVLNVLRHANSAQENKIEQGDFLADFPLHWWILLNNTLEKFDVRRYTESVSLLYILAEKNLASLIRIHPQMESCFDIESERYGPPILAALATGSQEAVQSILEAQAETHQQEPLRHYMSKSYSENRNKSTKTSRDLIFSRKRGVFYNVAELGDEVVLAFLCALGKLDLESKESHGWTPVLWATINGHEALAKLLLEKGADSEPKVNSGRTLLSWAVGAGHEVVTKLLLKKGADLESKSSIGRTPLSWAVGAGHEAVAKLLLKKGADLESKDISGRTPLSWAAEKGGETVTKLLLEKGADLETKDSSDRTLLSWAAGAEHEAVAKLLLEKGADLESKDSGGRTPLSWAAEKGRGPIVKTILNIGNVDVDSKDKDRRRTPLSWAAEKGHETVVKMLLDTGKVDVNSKDKDSLTPLLQAVKILPPQVEVVEKRCEAIIKMLLNTGKVDVDLKDKDGRTPLSWAAEKGHQAAVIILLDTGKANIDSKDKEGRTPLQWAKARIELRKSDFFSSQALQDHQRERRRLEQQRRSWLRLTSQEQASYEQHYISYEAVVKLLLATDSVEPDFKDPSGRTPLSWAVEKQHEAILEMLLNTGKVDVNSKDKDGRTPLLQAARNLPSRIAGMENEAVVKLLLQENAKGSQSFDPAVMIP
ncbi:hypothetical protein V494_08201 [Pseudogymnoascus sp. VKM F-4513 (FW-928)]|nr:hypothetical protein V494_08201 [Pseudogymnoascus sp. VKM F-4513 (FW-928)]